MTGNTLNRIKAYAGKAVTATTEAIRTGLPVARSAAVLAAKRLRSARALWLFAAELAGVVLVSYGISLWSIPAALIIGGLVLVAAVEVRPHVGKALPAMPVSIDLLRAQAEQAAIVLNADRLGLGYVDADAIARFTPAECERVIVAARLLGASKSALRARKASRLA